MNLSECLNTEQEKEIFLSLDLKCIGGNPSGQILKS